MGITTEVLDRLAQQYHDEGLPLPPPDAPLMIVSAGARSVDNKGKETPLFFLAFQIKPATSKTKPGTFLLGTEIYEPALSSEEAEHPPHVVDTAKPLPAALDREWRGPAFSGNTWLVLAIQCHLRGDHETAKKILAHGLTQERRRGGPTAVSSGSGWVDPKVNRSMAEPPPGGEWSESLAATAWNHWMNLMVEPGSNRKEIRERMVKLLADHPALDGPYQRALLESLRLTLLPGTSKPGSIEALIDGLTESTTNGGQLTITDPAGDPGYVALEKLGFEAVPALIEHLGDQRLTRSVTVGFNNFPTLPRRVGEVVSDLLEGLAGPELGQDWLQRQLGNSAEADPVRHWWEKVRPGGEEAYVCEHVVPAKKDGNDRVNLACLHIVAARYPQWLGKIDDRLLEKRPDLDSRQIAKAIGESTGLNKEEKVHLLRRGAAHRELGHRIDALNELSEIDPAEGETWLVKELDRLPTDVRIAYWISPEARITHQVMATDSPTVWKAFRRAVQRANVGLKLELLNPLDYMYIGAKHREQRLALLASFLDDETVRVIKGNKGKTKYDGPCAAFTFPTITVRDFAAMQIGNILDISPKPKESWDPARWAKYRAAIRAVLKKR